MVISWLVLAWWSSPGWMVMAWWSSHGWMVISWSWHCCSSHWLDGLGMVGHLMVGWFWHAQQVEQLQTSVVTGCSSGNGFPVSVESQTLQKCIDVETEGSSTSRQECVGLPTIIPDFHLSNFFRSSGATLNFLLDFFLHLLIFFWFYHLQEIYIKKHIWIVHIGCPGNSIQDLCAHKLTLTFCRHLPGAL